jgi:transcriptional regulator with XRE-family HTH domain
MRETNPPSGLQVAIAEAVRVEMARQRMTQRVLAEKTGLSQSYIGRRMLSEFAFTADDVERIATALGVPVTTLLPVPERAA